MNDLLIANEEDIITHCNVNIKDEDNDAYTHTHVITVAHVKNAIDKMKSGKSDASMVFCLTILKRALTAYIL